jgi:hypothetical protein
MRNLVLRVLTGSAIVASLVAVLAGAAPAAGPPGFVCMGSQFKLFDSWNGYGVLNSARSPIFSTRGRTYCVASVTTYHWNNGQGQAPGTVGLGVVRGLGGAGGALGPWAAAGSVGQGGAQNVNWSASPTSRVFINGIYTCRDSSPGTWAQNQLSRGRGFCAVYVTNAVATGGGAPQPAPAPAPAQATCAPTPPSTYLIYPNHVAPGGTTRFLLWCNKPASLGFRGAFAPLGVLIYDEQSFRNMHYVNGYLRPTSPSLPVRPAIVPVYRVLGDRAIEVSLPASMARTTYVPVIVWARGEVASQNLLDLR